VAKPGGRYADVKRLGAILALMLAGAAACTSAPPAKKQRPHRPKVLVIVYDPVIEAEGSKRLSQVCRWNDYARLTQTYVDDVRETSGGFVQYQVVETLRVDAFPVKKDGFRYTDETFLTCFRGKAGWHQPDAVDYQAIIDTFDLNRRVDRKEIDEVWVWSMPYSGFYESTMVGKGAYFCNSPPVPDPSANRIYVIMGFNYERGVGEMLEDLGHRTESIMTRVYGSWDQGKETHAWNRFTLYEKVAPGRAAAGNVHFAPNSTKDYEWGSKTPVWSTADDWLSYPHLTGKKRQMTAADWGSGDIRLHHKWWLARLPKAPGKGPDGKQANWWKYTHDFNRYSESR
jgi:hypothetical protein